MRKIPLKKKHHKIRKIPQKSLHILKVKKYAKSQKTPQNIPQKSKNTPKVEKYYNI